VLSARDARRGLIVAAACRMARSLGIRPQMSLSEAIGLSQRAGHNLHQRFTPTATTPSTNPASSRLELQVVEHDPQEDLERLCQLAEEAQRFSPIVGLEPLGPKPWAGIHLFQPQGLMLDIRGLGPLFGGEKQLAQQLGQWLASYGYQAVIAIADTVGAAWALSRYGWRIHIHTPTETSIANQPTETNQQTNADSQTETNQHNPAILAPLIQPQYDPNISADTAEQISNPILSWYLEPLPVEALRLSPPAVHKLQRLGIQTIGELLHLPRHSLASRLGDEVPTRLAQILGEVPETFAAWRPLPDFYLEQRLEYPTDRQDSLSELLRQMVYKLTLKMKQQGQGALRIQCCMRGAETPPRLLQLGLFRPSADPHHIQTLLVSQLERHWEEPASIDHVTLQVMLVEPLMWQQPQLFDSDTVKHRQQLGLFLDSLSSRLGRNQVLQPVVEGDPIPEGTMIYRPWTGRRTTGEKQSTTKKLAARWERRTPEPTPEDPLRRPLQLLPQPQKIQVISVVPDSDPAQFGYQGKLFRIIRCWGPERLESGWWRGPSQRRDYYRVETEQHQWWWLFRQLDNGLWFLHGSFD
jgi:protein ImuB